MVDGVMTVEWSTSSEWVLVTGGCDGAIRFWDIRRAGCFLVLDQSHSQLGRRPPITERSTTNKVFLMSFLFQKQILALLFYLKLQNLFHFNLIIPALSVITLILFNIVSLSLRICGIRNVLSDGVLEMEIGRQPFE